MASEFFGRQRECRFYTAGCGNKMAINVTGPRAVNQLGGPVIRGRRFMFPAQNLRSPPASALLGGPGSIPPELSCFIVIIYV